MKSVQDVEALDIVESLPAPENSLHFYNRFRQEAPTAFERLTSSPQHLRHFLTLASYSTFLSESVLRHHNWLFELANLNQTLSTQQFEESLKGFRSAFELAAFRRRQLLRIVLRDVLGIAPLADITAELSNLADAILNAAYRHILKKLSAQYGTPHTATGPALFTVISLGKLGGRELNYSSDIDLMFLYSGDGETETGLPNKEFFHKLANQFTE